MALRTDNYNWTVISGSTFQTGTFLCGEPWVVDNGDLTLTAVTPTEIEVTDNTLSSFPSGASGPCQIAILNPDYGKRDWPSLYQNENFAFGHPNRLGIGENDKVWCKDGLTAGAVSGDAITSVSVRHDDFRAGRRLSYPEQTGLGFYPDNGITFPCSLEAGDMVCLSYGHTGEVVEVFTESRAVLTVVESAPGASAFRPPINWDPGLKAHRPIYNEVYDLRGGSGGTAHEWQYPDYNFTSDTKTWTDTTPAQLDVDTVMTRTSPIFPMSCLAASEQRGTNLDQGISRAEYGNDVAMFGDSMLLHVFDPNVSGATQDILRRTLTQRGIDLWGHVHGQGAFLFMQGGHSVPYAQLVYLAWCVTGDPEMYNFLNTNTVGTAGNDTRWVQMANPSNTLFGDYNDSIHENGHMSRGNNQACSFRHFDLEVTATGTADNLHYVKVTRPKAREEAVGVTHDGTFNYPLWNNTASSGSKAAAGANWGWANNAAYVDTGIIHGAWIRVKGQSGGSDYSAITRVVNTSFYDSNGDTASVAADRKNPASAILWLQDDIIPEGGGITGADMSNAIENTRPNMWMGHSTRGLRQTCCEGGKVAYSYSSINGALNRWRLGTIKGYSNLPYWGKREHDKSVWMASNILGKNYFVDAFNAVAYNQGSSDPEDSLYHALMRWGPASGSSLPHVVAEYEGGHQTYPSGGTAEVWRTIAPVPNNPEWEEIRPDLTKIKVWTEGNYGADGGNIGWYRYNAFGGNDAGSTYSDPLSRNSTTWDTSDGRTTFTIKSNGQAQHSLFDFAALGWDLYVWPSLITTPYKLNLVTSNAAGPTDTSWEDKYEVGITFPHPENNIFSKEFGWTFVAAESGFIPAYTTSLSYSITHSDISDSY